MLPYYSTAFNNDCQRGLAALVLLPTPRSAQKDVLVHQNPPAMVSPLCLQYLLS